MQDDAIAEIAERWLGEAYEFIAAGWCRGATARDEAGRPVEPDSDAARSWSATGALVRAWRSSREVDDVLGLAALGRANLALTAAMRGIPKVWNDAPGRRQEQVLEAIVNAVWLVRDVLLLPERRAGVAARPAAEPAPGTPELGSAA